MRISERQWLLIIAALWLYLFGPGTIEGKLYPAATPAQIVVALPTDESYPVPGKTYYRKGGRHTAICVVSERLRHPHCRFKRLDWYIGKREGNSSPVKVETGNPIARPAGKFAAGPWILNIRRTTLFGNSYADVFHQCGYFGIDLPWLTKSRFWN